jgi:hypothetical protein
MKTVAVKACSLHGLKNLLVMHEVLPNQFGAKILCHQD